MHDPSYDDIDSDVTEDPPSLHAWERYVDDDGALYDFNGDPIEREP